MSFKPEVETGDGEWVSNGLTFATEAEAAAYVKDLYSRWTSVRAFRVVTSDEPARYRWSDSKLIGPLKKWLN